MADRDPLQAAQAELSPEAFPGRQPERHTDSDMDKYDSMASHAGHQKADKAEVESVKPDDGCPHPA